jgi:purine-binding chemotaxis protein CheW
MDRNLLFFRVASRVCALPVSQVEETMRPPAIEPLPETPSFVSGASIVRGVPTPVIDLGEFLSGKKLSAARRAVTVKVDGGRRVALLVSEVLGVRGSDEVFLGDLPPLLQEAAPEALSTLGRVDDRLLTVLRLGRLVPEPVWRLLSARRDGA